MGFSAQDEPLLSFFALVKRDEDQSWTEEKKNGEEHKRTPTERSDQTDLRSKTGSPTSLR